MHKWHCAFNFIVDGNCALLNVQVRNFKISGLELLAIRTDKFFTAHCNHLLESGLTFPDAAFLIRTLSQP